MQANGRQRSPKCVTIPRQPESDPGGSFRYSSRSRHDRTVCARSGCRRSYAFPLSPNASCARLAASSIFAFVDDHGGLDLAGGDHLDVDARRRPAPRRASRPRRCASACRCRRCESLAMPSSVDDFLGADLLDDRLRAPSWPWAGRPCCSVKEMSVVPPTLTFCTIMSTMMLASASALKMRAAMPGRSGTLADGDLGLVLLDARRRGRRRFPCSWFLLSRWFRGCC